MELGISPENQSWHKYYRFYTTSGSGTDSEYVGLTELLIEAAQKTTQWEMGGIGTPVKPMVNPEVATE